MKEDKSLLCDKFWLFKDVWQLRNTPHTELLIYLFWFSTIHSFENNQLFWTELFPFRLLELDL